MGDNKVTAAAYHHQGEYDSAHFAEVYPGASSTKLMSCSLCHTGGSYQESSTRTVDLGSCQWCHRVFGYDQQGPI